MILQLVQDKLVYKFEPHRIECRPYHGITVAELLQIEFYAFVCCCLSQLSFFLRSCHRKNEIRVRLAMEARAENMFRGRSY